MDSSHDEKEDSVVRSRGPKFGDEEVDCLLGLIEKHKSVILSRLITSEANSIKDATWAKIAKIFNKKGFKHQRTVENLRNKWLNLKRSVRQSSKNLIANESYNDSDQMNRVLALLYEQEHIGVDACLKVELGLDDEESSSKMDENQCSPHGKDSDDSEEGDEDVFETRKNRSLNFTPTESRLLLQCISEEKDYIFDKDSTTKSLQNKNRAWERITKKYNRVAEQKRTVRVLKTKFYNLRNKCKRDGANLLTGINNNDDIAKKIKLEKSSMAVEIDYDDDNDESYSETRSELQHSPNDPLEAVLNGVSESQMNWDQKESKEVVKLKLELLKHQIENAKLEKERILKATGYASINQDAKATLNSLRLRSARLEAAAAEAKFPLDHPSLAYNKDELRARDYMQQ